MAFKNLDHNVRHPDRLIAQHASKEKIAEANATIAALNTSYQRIMEDMEKP